MTREATLTDYERRNYTASAQTGLLLVRRMDDASVLAAARDSDAVAYNVVLATLGPDTNRSWITARFAEEAYKRGLIYEQELDWLTR